MKDMVELLAGLMESVVAGEIGSKVTSRRNWVVKTYDDTVVIAAFGVAERNYLIGPEYLTEIAKHKIRTFYYTYKADALKAYKALRDAGYKRRFSQDWYMDVE